MKIEANVVFYDKDAPSSAKLGEIFYIELFDKDYECTVMGIYRSSGRTAVRFNLVELRRINDERSK